VTRKNGRQLAEHAGEATPDGMQRLLSTADWDPDLVRDDLRGYVVEHLATLARCWWWTRPGSSKGHDLGRSPAPVLGHRRQGRQLPARRLPAYASSKGRAFIDRELYLPRVWIEDPARCRAARVPEQVGFRTKPQLARVMLERALDAGVPAAWVTADEVYGGDPALRRWLEDRGVSYVLAVKGTEPLGTATPGSATATQVAASVPPEQWVTCSAGHGAKGRRLYDWARVELAAPAAVGCTRWLLVRRCRRDGELAFYACYGPAETSLLGLVRVAGTRWAVEEGFQQAKGEVGLDHYEVRRWPGWYRHITLALLAHAFLVVTRTKATTGDRAKRDAAA
jgi:SRSO17 transposase